jgi:hypothetical protein
LGHERLRLNPDFEALEINGCGSLGFRQGKPAQLRALQ